LVERFGARQVKRLMNTGVLRSVARKWWQREIRPLLVLALVVFSIRSSLADWNDVPTGSMKPTILEGDRVFVNKLAYDLKVPFTTWHLAEWGNPRRGDIVVFYSPYDGIRLVKRVVGLPGDVIELRDEVLWVNGKAMEYSPLMPAVSVQLSETERRMGMFATEKMPGHEHAVMAIPTLPAKRSFGPVHVPEGQYFMMGDNRDNSFDSRFYGPVDRKRIVGQAKAVVLSFDRQHYWLPRWQRMFRSLDG
jgi:signal peptidase I